MIEGGANPRLPLEAAERGRVALHLHERHLHGDPPAVGAAAVRAVDGRHAASANGLAKEEPAVEEVTGRQLLLQGGGPGPSRSGRSAQHRDTGQGADASPLPLPRGDIREQIALVSMPRACGADDRGILALTHE